MTYDKQRTLPLTLAQNVWRTDWGRVPYPSCSGKCRSIEIPKRPNNCVLNKKNGADYYWEGWGRRDPTYSIGPYIHHRSSCCPKQLNIGQLLHKERSFRLPSINFEAFWLLVSGRVMFDESGTSHHTPSEHLHRHSECTAGNNSREHINLETGPLFICFLQRMTINP